MSPLGSTAPVVGETIAGRYRLERVIGVGGMGIVFAATDSVLGRELAVKVLSPQVAAHPEARQRFEREARVSAAIKHPNAVKIHDFGHDQGRLYIAMELLRGKSLSAHLGVMGKLTMASALKISYDVADVLAESHAEGLIHRDIKPENIFLERSGEVERVVVLDFGMAFLVEGEDEGLGRLTRDGIAGGTPSYMSPEQACGRELGPGCDIYALGCVMFELITGRPPYVADATTKILTQQLYAPAPDLREHIRGAPAALGELLQRMLSKRAEDRPTAATVRRRLAALEQITLGARERSRDASYLADRSARVLPRPTPRIESDDDRPITRVAVVAAVDEELRAALLVSGVAAIFVDAPADAVEMTLRPHVLYVPEPGRALIESAVGTGLPTVTHSEAASVADLRALLRQGVAEVITPPVTYAELARKIKRAARKDQRRRASSV